MLLISGKLVDVPGVKTLAPNAEPWNRLVRGVARTRMPQMKIIHKTIADDPEKVLTAVPPSDRWGGARDTVEDWADPKRQGGPVSGTQLISGHDGSTVCTADLARFTGWHGNYANDRSWGHEIKERVGGGYFQAAMDACVAVTAFDTFYLGVQQQTPKLYRKNQPNPRFRNGGVDLVGIFGHRDVIDSRGYWDPGDTVFHLLVARHGFETFDFYAHEDLDVWSKRQEWLKAEGVYTGAIDGIAGAGTTNALKKLGYPNGIFARWRDLAERPPMPPGFVA